VGLLVAIHTAVAAVSAVLFGRVGRRNNKGRILQLGSLCFAAVAFPFLLQPNFSRWNWGSLIAVYSLEGVGRATFEGTLKAVYADFFPYEKEGAFASLILQYGLASSAAYFSANSFSCGQPAKYCVAYRDGTLHDVAAFSTTVTVIAVAALVGFWRASCLATDPPAPGRDITVSRKTYQTVSAADRSLSLPEMA
jgi:MFS family permease